MKQQFSLCAALMLMGVGAGPADAQAIYATPRVYSPPMAAYPALPAEGSVPAREVISIVRSVGLWPLSAPVRRGPVYVLVAANRGNEVVRVSVDASTGDIIRIAGAAYDPQLSSVRPGAAVGVDPGARVSAPGPLARGARADVDGGLPPVPPRTVPASRTASAPAIAPEPSAPLPRPRPQIAASETATAPAAATPGPRTTGSIEAPVPLAPATEPAPPVAAAPPAAGKPELQFAPVVPLD